VCYQKHKQCRNYLEEMPFEDRNSGRERADIVTWRSRYLKEVQEYWDNGHLMLYMHKTRTDSNLTFCKCWQEGEVIGIHTHELGKQAYNAACRGNWWISSSMLISFTRLDLKKETTEHK